MANKPFLKVQSQIPGEWRVLHASQALMDLCGWEWEEIKGRDLSRLWGQGAGKLGKFLNLVVESSIPDTVEYWVDMPKGKRCYRFVCAPTHGGVVIITLQDLTEQRLVQKLDASIAIEVKQVFWSMVVPELRMEYVSSSVTPIFGYTQTELTNDPYRWQHIVHVDDREGVREGIETVLKLGRLTHEHRVVLDNGEIRWIRNKVTLVRDEKGKPTRMMGVITDITDERVSSGFTAESQSVYRVIVNEQMDPVLRYAPDLTVTFCNAAYAALYNKVPNELIGQLMTNFIDQSEIPAIRAATDELLSNGVSLQSELRKVLPDGSIRWFRWTDIQTTNPENGRIEIQTVGHDITSQKEMEAALKESRMRFSLATTGINDGIWDWELQSNDVWFSSRFKEQLGYEENELANELATLEKLMDPEDYQATQEQVRQYREGKIERIDIVQRYRNQKGAIVYIHCRAVGDRDLNGELVRLVGANTDVTRIIQAESRLRDAIDVISDGFVLFDPEDRIVLYNEQFRYTPILREMGDLTGVGFTEIAQKFARAPVTDIRALDNPDAWIAWRIARHQNPPAEGYEQQLTDGRWLRIIERRTAEGGYVGIWTDITALKQAEIRLRNAIESINEGFLLMDENMRIVMINDRLRQLYPISGILLKPGAMLEDVLRYAATHGEYPGVEDVERFVAESLRLMRPDRPIVYERALAEGRWVLASQRRTSNGDIVGVRTDITMQKKREEELNAARNAADQANAAKSRFLAHMSHELRTPLNAILGFTDVMRKGVFGEVVEPRYKQYLGFIFDSGHHLLSLINDILDLSKVEAGRRELVVERVHSETLVAACLQVVATQARNRNIELTHRIDAQAAHFQADLRAIKQVIINLLSNAVKFTPSGGKIDLLISTDGGYTIIGVKDTGIGMEEEDILKAFDPFGQIESDLARESEGTGLGLALVKSLVELHGGRIEVESAPKWGTHITVFIPNHPKFGRLGLPIISCRRPVEKAV